MTGPLDHWTRLQEGKEWFESKLDQLGPACGQSLGEEEWSLAQTVEHLVLVEKGFIISLLRASQPLPSRTAEQDRVREAVFAGLLSAQKYPVPVASVEPSAAPDPSALVADWNRLRSRLAAKVEAGLPSAGILVANHPIAGPLTAEEALRFLADHLTYHRIRTEQLLATVGVQN